MVHASPDVPAVAVAVAGGPVLFSNATFPNATDFADVDAAPAAVGSAETPLTVPDSGVGTDLAASVSSWLALAAAVAAAGMAAFAIRTRFAGRWQ